MPELDLGRLADSYIREQLAWRGHLARQIATIPLEKGRASVFVPREVPKEWVVENLGSGVWSSEERGAILDAFTQRISASISGPSSAHVILEEVGGASIYTPRSTEQEWFRSGRDVYYILRPVAAPFEVVQRFLLWTPPWHFFCAVTRPTPDQIARLPTPTATERERNIDDQTFQGLVKGLSEFTLGVFDGDGFLTWVPD
jgi:hypothetical protein